MTQRALARLAAAVASAALLAVVVLSAATWNAVRKAGRRIERIEAWLTTPVLEGVKTATLGGSAVKYREYPIALRAELDALQNQDFGRELPHPRFHVEPPGPGDVAFHPYQWSRNLMALAGGQAEGSAAADRVGAELRRAEPFVQRSADADWYPYPFDFAVGGVSLRAPWRSAFGQGWAVAAFVRLHRATGTRTTWSARGGRSGRCSRCAAGREARRRG